MQTFMCSSLVSLYFIFSKMFSYQHCNLKIGSVSVPQFPIFLDYFTVMFIGHALPGALVLLECKFVSYCPFYLTTPNSQAKSVIFFVASEAAVKCLAPEQ